jgi:Reverse transcriptase (RNA-dependent DNA polymerase)
MPDADFCSVVRSPYGHLSRRSDTEQISWGKFSHFPCTIAESTFRTLMDVDFAVSRPLVRRVEGTPQGGPLSPLLSNLVLDELDRELEHRGHRYPRYADDWVRSGESPLPVQRIVGQPVARGTRPETPPRHAWKIRWKTELAYRGKSKDCRGAKGTLGTVSWTGESGRRAL